ncbi:M28 family peptidase [Ignatzschineria indica]|uniref:M28 family peptidase n=1 Tax=Ignatzschineria indica TaxID=472583 RepID=UPI00362B8A6E
MGNLRARLEGERAETIYFGSHTDTVPGGGLYDGILGVIAGISVLTKHHHFGEKPQYSLELIDFLAEESSDWGSLVSAVEV